MRVSHAVGATPESKRALGAARLFAHGKAEQIEVGGGATIVVSGGYELVDQQGNKIATRQNTDWIKDVVKVSETQVRINLKTPFPAADRRGLRAYRHAIERGVVLRPLGDILYWMPPYCVGEEELLHLAAVTTSAIEEATRA